MTTSANITTDLYNRICTAVSVAFRIGEPYGQTIEPSELIDYLYSNFDTPMTGAIIAWVLPGRFGGKRVSLLEFTTDGLLRECTREQIIDMGVNDELHGDTDTVAYKLMMHIPIVA